MSLRSRIKALEAKRGGGLMTIIVSGGYAFLDGEIPDVRPEETFEDYCARKQAEARAAGWKTLVIHQSAWEWTRDKHGDFQLLADSEEHER
jgi:hypothetical protein